MRRKPAPHPPADPRKTGTITTAAPRSALSDIAILNKLGRGRSWTPWLVIRYTQSDQGQRPIPAGDVFWASPDIWVESSDPWGNAVSGEPNFVHAAVFNLGKAPALPTRLDFYWGNPSVGLGPGQMNLIGTEWVQVKPHAVQRIRCQTPWIPVIENGGHECLIVNCTSPILDPIKQPYQVSLDRHVGQRNVTVLEAVAGQTVHFRVSVNNFFPAPVRVTIATRIAHAVAATSALRSTTFQELANRLAMYVKPREGGSQVKSNDLRLTWSNPRIRATLSEPARTMQVEGARAYLGELLLEADRMSAIGRADTNLDVVLQETNMEAFEERHLDIELDIPGNIRTDEFLITHLLQRAFSAYIGGYTIIVRVVSR